MKLIWLFVFLPALALPLLDTALELQDITIGTVTSTTA
ncbi:hypothetical protein Ocin01_04891 [Orchesella cincta]|uniref:Uncharacterized protein n=1 Tax=Orchesella cincta TaxID=48709 RepID=A0A1D2N9W6_ORCCI|nr:hypothetical protein Ocin01_04891 [Orchesella cincta]